MARILASDLEILQYEQAATNKFGIAQVGNQNIPIGPV
jgi:hypothetical protein